MFEVHEKEGRLRGNGNYMALMNSDWLGAIVLFKFKDNLIVQGDFGQKMKACSANWRLFTIGFLVQRRTPERGFSELNLLTAVFFIYPLVGGGGKKNMFTIFTTAWALDDNLFATFFFFKFLFFLNFFQPQNTTFTLAGNNPW